MSPANTNKLRFGLWYDFRNPPQWKQPSDRLYNEILEQIVWGEQHGFDDVWLSEHHFIEDGYSPALLPLELRFTCSVGQNSSSHMTRAALAALRERLSGPC